MQKKYALFILMMIIIPLSGCIDESEIESQQVSTETTYKSVFLTSGQSFSYNVTDTLIQLEGFGNHHYTYNGNESLRSYYGDDGTNFFISCANGLDYNAYVRISAIIPTIPGEECEITMTIQGDIPEFGILYFKEYPVDAL